MKFYVHILLVLYAFDAMDFDVGITVIFKVLIVRFLDNLCHCVMTHAHKLILSKSVWLAGMRLC